MTPGAGRLAEAVGYARAHETPWPRDLRAHMEAGAFEPPPDNAVIGPTAPRGDPAGLVMQGGEVLASWGDTRRADMTFSVAKSYLSVLAGVAVLDGLIADLDEPVGRTVDDGGFEGPHNGAVTWRHLLQNTSEWEGTLFGKSDRIDRNRSLASEGGGRPAAAKGSPRTLRTPGTYWEYNDVRVNRLGLALLRRFGRPLPAVFAERIADPIGASRDWRWEGYDTSWVEVGGARVQSVPGGGHWGGGVFMGAADQALVGELMRNDGCHAGRRLLPPGWVAASATPCALNESYGLLWWLNTGGRYQPSAPHDSLFAAGAGGNFTWIDRTNGIVAVLRWIDPAHLDRFIARTLAALAP